jgi:hypothetical protein
LLFGLSVGVDRAFADDVTDVYADDVYAEPTDEVSEEVADDVPEEYADDAPEEYADDGGEEADENTGPSFGRIAWDVTLLRPLNFIRLVVGCALTIPITLLAQPGGIDNVQNMADYFVGQPYWDTFERPLGKF